MNTLNYILWCCTTVTVALAMNGGENVKLGDFPFMVSLKITTNAPHNFLPNEIQHKCNGVLVDKLWVLTSAMCVLGNSQWNTITNIDGEMVFFEDPRSQQFKVAKVVYNPEFTNNRWSSLNDIALIKLDKKANLNNNFQIAKLPQKDEIPNYNNDVDFVSFGSTPYLRTLKVPLLDMDECISIVADYVDPARRFPVPNKKINLCTGPKNNQQLIETHGDAGAALVQNGTVYAVESYALNLYFNRPDKNVPSAVWTQIAPYLDWIKATINEN